VPCPFWSATLVGALGATVSFVAVEVVKAEVPLVLAAVALSHDHQVDTIVRLRDREIIQPKQSAVNRGRGFHFKRLLDDVF